jgi:hypothetical protein
VSQHSEIRETENQEIQLLPGALGHISCVNRDKSEHIYRPLHFKQTSGGTENFHFTRRGSMRLTGFAAIDYAAQEGLPLNTTGLTPAEERQGLTLAEAHAIAQDNPQLIYVDVPNGGRATPHEATSLAVR